MVTTRGRPCDFIAERTRSPRLLIRWSKSCAVEVVLFVEIDLSSEPPPMLIPTNASAFSPSTSITNMIKSQTRQRSSAENIAASFCCSEEYWERNAVELVRIVRFPSLLCFSNFAVTVESPSEPKVRSACLRIRARSFSSVASSSPKLMIPTTLGGAATPPMPRLSRTSSCRFASRFCCWKWRRSAFVWATNRPLKSDFRPSTFPPASLVALRFDDLVRLFFLLACLSGPERW
mmetsp:Transcript_21528/g.45302  ORF Transcript_21528/g.45302 Transcript_21528/m.45302 type:complete len:233 (+) Transcript_21528:2163-2861(+)